MSHDPATIIFTLCHHLINWEILQTSQGAGSVELGVEKIKMVVQEIHQKTQVGSYHPQNYEWSMFF